MQAPSPERMARIWLLLARALVASGVFLLAGGLGYKLVTRIGDRGAGAPLPELTLSAAAAANAKLPPFARLIDTTPGPELTWLHDRLEGRVYHRDAFTPLTAPGWRPGDPVVILEEDRTVMGEDGPDADSYQSAWWLTVPKQARPSFLKKRSKKLLTPLSRTLPKSARQRSPRFFGPFFKKGLLAFCESASGPVGSSSRKARSRSAPQQWCRRRAARLA